MHNFHTFFNYLCFKFIHHYYIYMLNLRSHVSYNTKQVPIIYMPVHESMAIIHKYLSILWDT